MEKIGERRILNYPLVITMAYLGISFIWFSYADLRFESGIFVF